MLLDSQNLYLSVKAQGWNIDWKRFRIYLKNKYKVEKAYLFIGLIQTNSGLLKIKKFAKFRDYISHLKNKISLK